MSPLGSQGGFRKMKAHVKPARDGWLSALTAASTIIDNATIAKMVK